MSNTKLNTTTTDLYMNITSDKIIINDDEFTYIQINGNIIKIPKKLLL